MPDDECHRCSAGKGGQPVARTCDEQKEVSYEFSERVEMGGRRRNTRIRIISNFFTDSLEGDRRIQSLGKTRPWCSQRRWTSEKENIYRPSDSSVEGKNNNYYKN